MLHPRWFLIILLIGLVGCVEEEIAVESTTTDLQLGDSVIGVRVHQAAAPGLTYINVHDDEDTAVNAALEVIQRRGGRVIELVHTGERNLSFELGDSTYTVDANRIFTERGAIATMRDLGAYSEAAQAAVGRFAQTLTETFDLGEDDVVLTVHNNTENRYSTLSYLDGGAYEIDALFTYYNEDRDPDDFFFVTSEDHYNAIRDAGYNVVLQDNAVVTDDGSLSVYYAERGMPYINAEAQHGHLDEQVEMLLFIDDLLTIERD